MTEINQADFNVFKAKAISRGKLLDKTIAAIAIGAVLALNILAFCHAQNVADDQAKINQENIRHG